MMEVSKCKRGGVRGHNEKKETWNRMNESDQKRGRKI